ncbi:MAG: hypothetical protein NT172_16595 [Planctomycetota bacterium]|nr:hypothetical protein [Planctomycetota bacterium]
MQGYPFFIKYGLRRLVDDRISSIPDARVPISIADKDWPVAISIESFTFRFLIVFKKAVAEGSLSMWVWLECSTFQGGVFESIDFENLGACFLPGLAYINRTRGD